MNFDEDMQGFLNLFDKDLLEVTKNESIEEYVKEEMTLGKYNENLKDNEDRDIIFEYLGLIDETKKTKNTGWTIYAIDIEAIEDFIFNRSCTKQDVLKYALRHYIPKEIYEIVLSNGEVNKQKTPIDNSNLKLNELKEKYADLNEYHKLIKYKSVYVSDKYNNLESKPSWVIPNIDYLAMEIFKKLFSIEYRFIATNAIRYYLMEQNYRHAEERIETSERHKNENKDVYRSKLNGRL